MSHRTASELPDFWIGPTASMSFAMLTLGHTVETRIPRGALVVDHQWNTTDNLTLVDVPLPNGADEGFIRGSVFGSARVGLPVCAYPDDWCTQMV